MRNEPESKLLRPKSESLVPVKMDVFVHDPRVLSDVREALEAGLKPVAFSLIGDSVVLRLERKPLQEDATEMKLLLGNR
jgi:hypothetical protein